MTRTFSALGSPRSTSARPRDGNTFSRRNSLGRSCRLWRAPPTQRPGTLELSRPAPRYLRQTLLPRPDSPARAHALRCSILTRRWSTAPSRLTDTPRTSPSRSSSRRVPNRRPAPRPAREPSSPLPPASLRCPLRCFPAGAVDESSSAAARLRPRAAAPPAGRHARRERPRPPRAQGADTPPPLPSCVPLAANTALSAASWKS